MQHSIRSKADELVEKFYKKRKYFTIAIGVVTPEGQQIWGYGQPDSNVDYEHSIFEIGSVTKTFLASLLAVMVKEDKVRLTDTIALHIPEVKDPGVGAITLEQLATHTSGLSRLPHNLFTTIQDKLNPYKNYTEQHLLSALTDTHLAKKLKPGRFEYSNFGYGVLGYILSKVANASLEDAIVENITSPLGMKDTVLTLRDDQISRRMPVYKENGKQVKHWEFGVLAGAGALSSTVSDLLQYVRCNVGLVEPELSEKLSTCHDERYREILRIGLGWIIGDRSGNTFHWHNGGTYGSTSYVAFHRETQTGVVVLTNNGLSAWSQIKASLLKSPMAVDAIGNTLMLEMIKTSTNQR